MTFALFAFTGGLFLGLLTGLFIGALARANDSRFEGTE